MKVCRDAFQCVLGFPGFVMILLPFIAAALYIIMFSYFHAFKL